MALIGWDNWVERPEAALVASAAAPGMGPEMLRVPLGNPALAWQTPPGVTAGTVTVTLPAAAPLRAVCLARTNLTPAATMRVRALPPGGGEPVAVTTDSLAGASMGGNTTRDGVGTPGPDTGPATRYTNSATSQAFVRGGFVPVRAGVAYRLTLWVRRVSGATTTGQALVADIPNALGGVERVLFPMTALAQGTAWQQHTLNFTSGGDGVGTFFFVVDTGALQFELADAILTPLPIHDSGTIPAGVVAGVRQALHILPAGTSAAGVEVTLDDAANPDRCLNVPLLWAGDAASLSITPESEERPSVRAQDVQTRDGTVLPQPLSRQRGWQIRVGILREAEAGWFAPLEAAAAARRNVLFVPREASPQAPREAVLGLLDSGGRPFVGQSGGLRSWSATITERL